MKIASKISNKAMIIFWFVYLFLVLLAVNKMIHEPSIGNIIYYTAAVLFGFYYFILVFPIRCITANADGIEYLDFTFFKKGFKILKIYKWHDILELYPNQIFYIGLEPKSVFLKCSNQEDRSTIEIGTAYSNFKEILVYIGNNVSSNIIHNDVKKLIDKYKKEAADNKGTG